jgi:hypothetical protein
VDYFSLDVEGNELQILKTLPFDKINIRVSYTLLLFANSKTSRNKIKRGLLNQRF